MERRAKLSLRERTKQKIKERDEQRKMGEEPGDRERELTALTEEGRQLTGNEAGEQQKQRG